MRTQSTTAAQPADTRQHALGTISFAICFAAWGLICPPNRLKEQNDAVK